MPKTKARSKSDGLPIIHPFAAGIDIGSRFHIAAVSPDLCDEPVQTFQAFTSDLERMADWLVAMGTRTVVMESTAHPAHAEGADLHEYPATPRDRHHYRCHGDADHPRHR